MSIRYTWRVADAGALVHLPTDDSPDTIESLDDVLPDREDIASGALIITVGERRQAYIKRRSCWESVCISGPDDDFGAWGDAARMTLEPTP